jgi:ABC-type nitrate/sulfonate/bicarbonate transport system substrate-binding protein
MGLAGPGLGCCHIVTRADLFASGKIAKVADVKSLTIASPVGINSIVTYELAKWLEQGGLKLSDINLTQLGLNEIAAGLLSKRLDIGYLAVPVLTPLLQDGSIKVVGDFDAVRRGLPSPGLVMGEKMLKQRPEVAAAFLRAIIRAADRDLQGNYLADPRVLNALAKQLNLPPDRVKAFPVLDFPKGLPVDPKALDEIQRFFVERGFTEYKQPMPADRLVDMEIRPAAQRAVAAMP